MHKTPFIAHSGRPRSRVSADGTVALTPPGTGAGPHRTVWTEEPCSGQECVMLRNSGNSVVALTTCFSIASAFFELQIKINV